MGRRWNLDPKPQISVSDYACFANNPILKVDAKGDVAGDYYTADGSYLGNDGIDDNRVYTVEGVSRFHISYFREGNKYYKNHSSFNKDNGEGFSVSYIGQVSDVFVTGDKVSDKKIQSLHPAIRMKATMFIKEANESSGNTLIRVSQGYRTYSEQNSLYAKGRTKGGSIVTNAKGGYSNHNFGFALDIVGITNGKVDYNLDWGKLSKIGGKHGFEWGGDWKFKDKPHFERKGRFTMRDMRNMTNSGKTTSGGYIKLR